MTEPHAPLTFRPAQPEDIPALAGLLVQLYNAELPGALHGPPEGQRRLMRYTLEQGEGALFRRYVAVASDGQLVGTGSYRLARDKVFSPAPPGTVRRSVSELGLGNTAFLFMMLLRAGLVAESQLGNDGAYIHSLVVDERARGSGVGAWMLGQIERLAAADGASAAHLRVIVANARALPFYQRLGYRATARTSPLIGWATYPCDYMTKALSPAP
ncbi:GNAT family N-acetyltransferase [Chloroflexia bacterium SDU3-3]|nr:GNAT family N-acetyltransferase [Chloroflexia bacterium SDU3-3]